MLIEGDAGGHTQAFRIRAEGSVRGHAIDGAVIARGNVKLALRIKRQPSSIHQLRQKRLDVVTGINLVDCDRYFLPPAPGKSHKNIAIAVDCRICYRVQALRNGLRDLELASIADIAVVLDRDLAGLRAKGHPSNQKIFRAYNNGATHAAEGDFRAR